MLQSFSKFSRFRLQTYRHDMTYSVLKVQLNPNQPTSRFRKMVYFGTRILCLYSYFEYVIYCSPVC